MAIPCMEQQQQQQQQHNYSVRNEEPPGLKEEAEGVCDGIRPCRNMQRRKKGRKKEKKEKKTENQGYLRR